MNETSSRTNAKDELLEALGDNKIKAAVISYNLTQLISSKKVPTVNLSLSVGYSQEEFEAFLNALNFVYDASFGGNDFDGTIWLMDQTWIGRGLDDGSSWWVHRQKPEIPRYLLGRKLSPLPLPILPDNDGAFQLPSFPEFNVVISITTVLFVLTLFR